MVLEVGMRYERYEGLARKRESMRGPSGLLISHKKREGQSVRVLVRSHTKGFP